MNALYDESPFLEHHGIKGQKWGVRRFQNPDGTLTAAGKKRYLKLQKNVKGKESGNAREKLVKAQLMSSPHINSDVEEVQYSKYRRDSEYRKRMDEAADLGLKVLSQTNNDLKYGEWEKQHGISKKEFQQSNREWFLFEDQTIGMPQVASMINNGATYNDVKKLIRNAEQAVPTIDELHISDGSKRAAADTFIYLVAAGNYEDALINFAAACEKAKHQSK